MQTGPGFALTFLYYFAITTAIVTPLSMQMREVAVPGILNPLIGVGAGLLGAYFNRSQTLIWPVTSTQMFQPVLVDCLAAMGYAPLDLAEVDADLADWTVYERSGWSQVFSGKIYVKMAAHEATIASRAMHIRQLRTRLQASLNSKTL